MVQKIGMYNNKKFVSKNIMKSHLNGCLWDALDNVRFGFWQRRVTWRFADFWVPVGGGADKPLRSHIFERNVGVATKWRSGAELSVLREPVVESRFVLSGVPHPWRHVPVFVNVFLRCWIYILDSLGRLIVSYHQDISAIVVVWLSENKFFGLVILPRICISIFIVLSFIKMFQHIFRVKIWIRLVFR